MTRNLALAIILMLGGCNSQFSDSALAGAQEAQRGRLERLEDRLDRVEQDNLDRLMRESYSVYLKPNADGFSVLDTPTGKLTVNIESVEASANGSRAVIRLGNLTSATITNLNASVGWGKVDDKGLPLPETGERPSHVFAGPILPGTWADREIRLENLTPDKVGYIRISKADFEGARMTRP